MAAIAVPVAIGIEEAALWLLAAVGLIATAKTMPKVEPRVKEECEDPDHRGRIQAQGGVLNDSAPWAQAFPPPKVQGMAMLDGVYAGLSAKDQKIRAIPYSKIAKKIAAGPIYAPYIKSEYAPPNLQSKDGDLRMDLEVRKGYAFV